MHISSLVLLSWVDSFLPLSNKVPFFLSVWLTSVLCACRTIKKTFKTDKLNNTYVIWWNNYPQDHYNLNKKLYGGDSAS